MASEQDAPPPYIQYPDQDPGIPAGPSSPQSPTERSAPAPKPATSFTSPQTQSAQRFPSSWTLRRGPASHIFHVASPSGTPLYAVTQRPGSSTDIELTLHNGPDEDDPPLSLGSRNRTFTGGVHSVISLPGSGSGISPEEPLRTTVSWPHISYSFDVDVGQGTELGRLRRETFEWRHSGGSAISSLGAASSGWKLLRSSTEPPPGIGDQWSFLGGGEASSDGKEIVAIWAEVRRGVGVNEVMRFRFLGTGASGALGERWAIMTAMTALRMWQQGQLARR